MELLEIQVRKIPVETVLFSMWKATTTLFVKVQNDTTYQTTMLLGKPIMTLRV